MSLLVYVYTRDSDGGMNILHDEHAAELAGVESCRTTLWGAPAVVSLGLTLLPTLAHGNVYAEGQDLERLEQEIRHVLDNLAFLSAETVHNEVYIRPRAQNILNATLRAKRLIGGVAIE